MRVCIFLFILFASSICEAVQPIIPCEMNRQDQRAGGVAICMIFQNEARFIKEWIDYHKMIGVTHFYLYNNGSSDGYWEILLPYIAKGEVELFNVNEKTTSVIEHNALQRAVYDHALKCARDYNKWVAIIDSDEFICMPSHENLGEFLEPYSYAGALLIHWVMYGSSNIEQLPEGAWQIEYLTHRVPSDWKENFSFKSIVQPKRIKSAGVHLCSCRSGYQSVYANHEIYSKKPKFDCPPIEEIRLNHYWWRDETYFREVKLPRRSGWLTDYTDDQIEEMRQIYNAVYDESMVPSVKKMREKNL